MTGFDASAAGIKLTVAEAAKRRLRVTALMADVDSFDYGQERWDLVAGLCLHEIISIVVDAR